MLFIALPAFAQDEKVCIGAKAMYVASGLNGSTFEYGLEQPQAGKIILTYSDSIVVEWGDTKGIFQLGVRETSRAGCSGNWAYLNVEVVGDYAEFTQPRYSFCGDGGVFVDFNREHFKAYEWVDKTVPEDGHITKPGRYELRTIDQNNCRLSSFIDVVQTPTPNVYLGADTMICTPGFTLYARRIQNNPEGTVYTWSTGASGVFERYLTVDDRNLDEDVTYWVRAENNGCAASDTVTVLACITEPSVEIPGIPNTFTPNEDGDNDTWVISMLDGYPDCIVEVFDRWGRKVFTSAKGYPQPWDGRNARGQYLPMETYYYIIHLNDGVTEKPILGTITIIR
jgi:gliding motility-associated-like protein